MAAAMFRGGPAPVYPSRRPVPDNQKDNKFYKPLAPEDDHDWLTLIKFGGAGEEADSPEKQKERYMSVPEDSPEIQPGLGKYVHRSNPDLVLVGGLDYTIRSFDPNNNFERVQMFEGHTQGVNCLCMYHGDMLLSAGDDMTVRKWKVGGRGSPEFAELQLTIWISDACVKAVCGLPGQRCAVGGLDKSVRILSLANGATLHKIDLHGEVGPDGDFMQKEGCGAVACFLHLRWNVLCSGANDSTIRLWDIDTGECLSVGSGHPGYQEEIGEQGRLYKLSRDFAPVWSVCPLGDDGTKIATASYDRTVCMWDVSDVCNPRVLHRWVAGTNGLMNVNSQADGFVVTCGADKEVKVYKVWERDEDGSIEVYDDTAPIVFKTRGIAGATCRIDDTRLFIGNGDACMRVVDLETRKDLIGDKYGFGIHVMDFSIQAVERVFFEDVKHEKYIEQPIMYRSCLREEGEGDARAAIMLAGKMYREAVNYSEEMYDRNDNLLPPK